MKKKWLVLLAALSVSLAISGCGGKTGPKVDLSGMGEIHAVAREEGSGTKNEFDSMTGISDEVTKNHAKSTEEAMKQVASDKNAIAYVAFNAVKIQPKGIKVVSVDTIEPTDETIGSGKYPLTRTYYLCWNGDRTPAEVDFIKYIHTAGQGFVPHYAVPISAPATFLSDKPSGNIKIAGSTSMAELVKDLSAKYMEKNPSVKIDIDVTDSTKGLTAAIRGEADLAMSSRHLKSYEAELLQTEPVARDGIAIIVNAESPVQSLSKDQIQGIFSGKWKEWKEIQ